MNFGPYQKIVITATNICMQIAAMRQAKFHLQRRPAALLQQCELRKTNCHGLHCRGLHFTLVYYEKQCKPWQRCKLRRPQFTVVSIVIYAPSNYYLTAAESASLVIKGGLETQHVGNHYHSGYQKTIYLSQIKNIGMNQ